MRGKRRDSKLSGIRSWVSHHTWWQELWSHRDDRRFVISAFVLLSILGAVVFYVRFPNNFSEPNFYAEDGNIFYRTLHEKGLLGAIATPFNGYGVVGLYLLEQVGGLINVIIGHDEFVNLPRSFAVVSYLFLGMTCSLPIILLRRLISPRYLLVLLYLMLLLIPLPSFDYAIIGTIGNLKFAFIFIAFVLLIYRNHLPFTSRRIIIVDLLLLICAYTNVTVYLLLPFALLPFVQYIGRRKFRLVFRSVSFISLAALGLLLIPQLIIAFVGGIPENKGYLDAPYTPQSTIEIFLYRTLLFPFIFMLQRHINDVFVVVIAIAVIGVAIASMRQHRDIVLFSLYTALVASILFIVKRTGVGELYTGYHNSGPDQFFYAQNWIMIVGTILVIAAIWQRISKARYRVIVFCGVLLIILGCAPYVGSYGTSNFMEKTVGNIYASAQRACSTNRSSSLSILIYPSQPLSYNNIDRSALCTSSTLSYYPRHVSFGLMPDGNQYVTGLGTKNHITQTFQSPRNNLDGVGIYFSTFLARVGSDYQFILYDQSCRHRIRSVELNEWFIKDNSFHVIHFEPLTDSAARNYCFTVTASHPEQSLSPLAVQLSKPDIYRDGTATLNGKTLERDVVFEVQYR